MAKLMRQHALDVQQRAKNATANAKKKAVSSDLSSARGSEERHASATTTARGQKRARNMEVEEVGDSNSLLYNPSLFNEISALKSATELGTHPGTGLNIPEEATTRRYQTRAARLDVAGRPVKLQPTNVYPEVLSRPRKRPRFEEYNVQVKKEVLDSTQGISEGVVRAVQPTYVASESRSTFTRSQIPKDELPIRHEATLSPLGQLQTQLQTSNNQSYNLSTPTNPRVTHDCSQETESACSTVSGKEENIDDELPKSQKVVQSVFSTPQSLGTQEKLLDPSDVHSLEQKQKADYEMQNLSELEQSNLSTPTSPNVQATKSEPLAEQSQEQVQKVNFKLHESTEIARSVSSTPYSLDIQEEFLEPSTVQSPEPQANLELQKAPEAARSPLSTPKSQNILDKPSKVSTVQPFEQEVDHGLQKLSELARPALSTPTFIQERPFDLATVRALKHQVAHELPKLPSLENSALPFAPISLDGHDETSALSTEQSIEHQVALALIKLSRSASENPALYSLPETAVGQKKPPEISTVQSTRHYTNSTMQAGSRASTIPEEKSPQSDDWSSPFSSLTSDSPSIPSPTIPSLRTSKRKREDASSVPAENATTSSKRKRRNGSPSIAEKRYLLVVEKASPLAVEKPSPLAVEKPSPIYVEKSSPPVAEKPTFYKRKRGNDPSPVTDEPTSSSKPGRGNDSSPITENPTSSDHPSLSLASFLNSQIAPAPKVLLSPASLGQHDFPWLFEGKEDKKPAKGRRGTTKVTTYTTRIGGLSEVEKLAEKDYAAILKTCKVTAEPLLSLDAGDTPEHAKAQGKNRQQKLVVAGIPKDDPEFAAECEPESSTPPWRKRRTRH